MKKIASLIISALFILTMLFGVNSTFASETKSNCIFELDKDGNFKDKEKGLTGLLDNCMNDTSVVAVKETGLIEDGFKKKIQKWTNNIALFLALLSVGAVIYGGLMMTLSTGDDEKIKKAKDMVKWALIGFLGVVLATTIVTLIINVIYGLTPA